MPTADASPLKVAKVRALDTQTRAAARKSDLIAELIQHKKNSCRSGAVGSIERISAQLAELANIVAQGAGSLANIERSSDRLDQWLAR